MAAAGQPHSIASTLVNPPWIRVWASVSVSEIGLSLKPRIGHSQLDAFARQAHKKLMCKTHLMNLHSEIDS